MQTGIIDGLENNKVGGWYQGQPAIIADIAYRREAFECRIEETAGRRGKKRA